MGGRGSSNPGGVKLSPEQKTSIRNGVANHTSAQNDRAEAGYKRDIAREKEIVDRKSDYIRVGYIKSASDPWFQGHLNSYNTLVAKYNVFKKERKRQKR